MSYKIYTSDVIKQNHFLFLKQSYLANKRIVNYLNLKDPTWDFNKYNLFCVTSMSKIFYKLYKELNVYIRDFVGDDRALWINAWLNYHQYKETEKKLQFHNHSSAYHGYVCIDPHDTTTEFQGGFNIKNKIGQIYLGPGGDDNKDYYHRVINNSYYSKPRITIGFNVADINDFIGHPIFIPIF
jgi:hypothetical protein|tara:strand:+ start:90 stop:638 length:549 start_codon:yes stop_codon:yes gene_type:complete